MASILLAGCASGDASHGGGACSARTTLFRRALESAGHEVDLCECGEGDGSMRKLRRLLRAGRYDAVTTVSPYPAETVVAAGCRQPLWIDINGVHPAEVITASDDPVMRRIHMARILSLESAILLRGDAFSVPSCRQRYAVIGELLLLGRLDEKSLGRAPVTAIPHCVSPGGGRPQIGNPCGGDVFMILSTGSFNTWFDHETLFHGLSIAMKADSRIRFTATGGATSHSCSGWDAFSRLVEASPFRDRIRLAGWLPEDELEALYYTASAGVYADLPGIETELGARTRVLDWISRGIPVVCTAGAEISDDIASEGLGLAVRQKDPEALAGAFLRLASDSSVSEGIRINQGKWCDGKGSMKEVFKPYLEWVESPSMILSKPVGGPVVPAFRSAGYYYRLFREVSRTAGILAAIGKALDHRRRGDS